MFKRYLKIFLLLLPIASFAQKSNLPELIDISFEGNKYFGDSELLNVIALKESPNAFSKLLNSIFGTGEVALYFDSLRIDEELQRLKSFYFNHGFFKTDISSHFVIDTTSNEASIQFVISEGSPTYYKDVRFFGVDSLSEIERENIFNLIDFDSTYIYSYASLSELNNKAITYLRNNGYMFSQIDSTLIKIDSTKNFIYADIYLTTGEKYKISDILVSKKGEGKAEVDDILIQDIVGIKPNETYSQFKTQRGQSRLYKTNLFTVASVKTNPDDSLLKTNKVPLLISTEIGKMYEITPEVIMNNEDNRFNLGLGAGFSKKNFFGGARILTLNASIAAQNIFEFISNMSVSDTSVIGYADLRLIMDQPFLFGKNISTRYEIYSTLQKRRNEYNTTALGFKVSLNFELPEYVYLTSLGTTWNLENLNVLYIESYLKRVFSNILYQQTDLDSTQVDSAATILSQNISKSAQSNNTLLSFNLGANKTNDFGFPSSGYKINLLLANANFMRYTFSKLFNQELTSPLYYKVQLDYSIFPNIYNSKKDAFGIKFRLGNIHVYNGYESSVPYNQRFTSGGSNSVRGWQSRELVPEFNLTNIDINSISPTDLEALFLDQAAPGGLFLLEGSIETRNRIFGSFGGALFLDYGNTWQNVRSFRFQEIAVSAGFGFRYYTDFIPFRLDFGIKLYDPKSGIPISKRNFFSDLLQIHFAIGEAF